jgi:MptA/FolE2 family GTP cyclohydrolase
MREKQDCAYSIVKIKGTYFHTRKTKISNKTTNDKLYLLVNVINDKRGIKIEKGIQAYNMTACPCTKTFTKFSVVPELMKLDLNKEKIQKIIDITHPGSHTQRGLVTVLVDKNSETITFSSLYEILDKSCHLVYELLKRPDEHNLVVSALGRPQFTEDVVRDVAYQILNTYKGISDKTRVSIESLLFDSIHIHDVYTKISKTFGEIRKEIKK